MSTLQKDRGEILVFYILMGVVGYDSYLRFADWSIELRFLAADLVMMMIAFLLSLYKRNSSVYDAYWSVIPFYFMLVFYFESTEWNAHQWVYAGLVSGWSWRLTYNWYRSWSGWRLEIRELP
jgi:steroid 5-alpha reductase family enzyme